MEKQCMDDRERLNDSLISQKQISASYNTFAGECENPQLRSAFLDILTEEHAIQNAIITVMERNGWYMSESAEQEKINNVIKKFCS